jgi:hypothetical protein
MTNEEALRLIKSGTGNSFVVWSLTANAIIAVHAVPPGDDGLELLDTISDGNPTYSEPVKARFLDPTTTTLATLEEEQHQEDQVHRRVSIFRSWVESSTDELLRILENVDFRPPMDAFHGHRHIVRQLYYSPVRVLSREQLGRLDAIARPPQELVADQLECALAVLHKDRDRLERFWSQHSATYWDSEAFTIAVGDLQLDSRDVVEHLIETVRRPNLFEPRFNAMVALGKIGAPAGDDAASAIAEHIWESSDWVAAVRSLSIQRIRTPAADWHTCTDCVRGMVPDMDDGLPYFRPCPACYGLSWIKLPDPPNRGPQR